MRPAASPEQAIVARWLKKYGFSVADHVRAELVEALALRVCTADHAKCVHDAHGSMGTCAGTGTRPVAEPMLSYHHGYGECSICGRGAKLDDQGNLAAHEARLRMRSVQMGGASPDLEKARELCRGWSHDKAVSCDVCQPIASALAAARAAGAEEVLAKLTSDEVVEAATAAANAGTWAPTSSSAGCLECGHWTPARHPERHDHASSCSWAMKEEVVSIRAALAAAKAILVATMESRGGAS